MIEFSFSELVEATIVLRSQFLPNVLFMVYANLVFVAAKSSSTVARCCSGLRSCVLWIIMCVELALLGLVENS